MIAAAVMRAAKGFAPATIVYDECAITPMTMGPNTQGEIRAVVVTSPDGEEKYAVLGALPDPSSVTGLRVVHLDMRSNSHPTVVTALAML